ncbi:MAG: U32 family peptidase [Defluviitaleaceae bacterium]|nr:U32 family peptidase [Defluviitaleaceae bacterium]
MMSKPELLAPAGSIQTLKAAVQAGADAVYLGAGKFSARAYAKNFHDGELAQAIEYTSAYGIKVYLAVNILMTDRELKEAVELVGCAYELGAAAFIVQDIGLSQMIKRNFPNAELHASTQMTAKTADDVNVLEHLGFSRVVMARELSRAQLQEIARNVNIGLEVFVHGALCASYSGQCLMSSFIGGRSANRGKCAQPCRLPYRMEGAAQARGTGRGVERGTERGAGRGVERGTERGAGRGVERGTERGAGRGVERGTKRGAGRDGKERDVKFAPLLSLKDLCLIDYVKELIEMGIVSLKIEGRMKGEDYVSATVKAYRAALDGKTPTAKEKERLLNVFNRGGYTDGYYTGNKNDMYMKTLKNPYKG